MTTGSRADGGRGGGGRGGGGCEGEGGAVVMENMLSPATTCFRLLVATK